MPPSITRNMKMILLTDKWALPPNEEVMPTTEFLTRGGTQSTHSCLTRQELKYSLSETSSVAILFNWWLHYNIIYNLKSFGNNLTCDLLYGVPTQAIAWICFTEHFFESFNFFKGQYFEPTLFYHSETCANCIESRQTGQLALRSNHLSTQSAWKRWRQYGSLRNSSLSW